MPKAEQTFCFAGSAAECFEWVLIADLHIFSGLTDKQGVSIHTTAACSVFFVFHTIVYNL